MNEKLAIEILTRVRNEMHGQHDIYQDLLKTKTYWDLKESDYSVTINQLKENRCILPFQGGTPKTYFLNTEKDCFGLYSKKIDEINAKESEEEKTKRLTNEKLEIDLANAKRVYETYGQTRAFAWVAVIISVILGVLKLVEVFGWLPQKP